MRIFDSVNEMTEIPCGLLQYLVDELDDETSGHFWKVLQGLMVPFAEYDAFCIHNAVQGLGTDEDCLIEILASRSNGEIENMKAAYKQSEYSFRVFMS